MKKRESIIAICLAIFLINLVSSMTITITSPVNEEYYDTGSVDLTVSSTETVNWIAYLDGGYQGKHNSDTQWSESDFFSGLQDGSHTVIISASNSTTNVNSTINFYVDTLFPNITAQTPSPNYTKYAGEIAFSVSYTEANLNSTKIYWKNQSESLYRAEEVTCASGSAITCSKALDFSSFAGENISYFFSLTDKLSKNSNFSIDTIKIIACSKSWECTEWGNCSSGTQTRTCTKICENGTETPAQSQSCSCTAAWECTSWSSCSGSTQTRTCTDSKNCGNSTDKPAESQSCGTESTTTNSQESTSTQSTNPQNVNYFLSDNQFNNGTTRTLRLIGDKISFKVKTESHSLELKKIYSDRVAIKISSVEQNANLTLNEVKKFDLTADGYYDVLVSLKRLTASEVEFLINATDGKVPEALAIASSSSTGSLNVSVGLENSGENGGTEAVESSGSKITGAFLPGVFLDAVSNMKKAPVYLLVIFLVIILGLLGTTVFMILKKKKKRKKAGYYK